MVFTQRERYIVIGTVAAVVLFALDRYVIAPFFESETRIARDTEKVRGQLDDASRVFRKERQLRHVWADMNAGGLKLNPSEAESQALHALRDWAQESGLNLSSLKPERVAQEGKFLQFGFHATGMGPQRAVDNLLWRVETASIPVRVNEVQLTSRREGADDLQLQLSVSTLCLLPDAPDKSDRSKSVSTAAMASAGGRP